MPVLELLGQSATVQPYLALDGLPSAEAAGGWHLSCLQSTPVGEQWARALEHSYLNVRQYALVAHTPVWTVVRNPRSGEVLGLNHRGATLPLSGQGPMFSVPGIGLAYRVSETDFWLEWDTAVVAAIQDRLRRTGSVPVREVAAQLGIDGRLSHPDLLRTASFRFDESLEPEWVPTAVGASVEYAVHLPDELAPYYSVAR
jgi:hypothetical protein